MILSQQLGVVVAVTNTDIPQIASDDTLANDTNPISLIDALHDYSIEKEYHVTSDITILLTSRRLSTGSNNYVGYAKIETICSTNSLVIVSLYDNGLDGQTLAHEIIHVLGAVHDGNEPCEATSSRGYLMSAAVHNGSDNLSQCSIDTVATTLARRGYCLLETSTVDPVDPVIPVIEPISGGGSIGMLAIQVLGIFVVFKMWLSQCWMLHFLQSPAFTTASKGKAWATFWFLIAIMVYLAYLIITNIAGMI